ncbi:type II toxin-antitoxin system VapC family toxin [Synechococcus sp. CS-1325]|uniref:type II toxin-antitoxin system VapC family toxin n=1 Tax=unclassified Synechococcus TaxID=2626047 RepID=UPI000DB4E170|nr:MULTISPECIES: type II toxin-antitoxin system VapC family toxin [unclassified Synechococcus]MCT0199230.1 type II toxin-antitoxin system VapC family toxin [Synechococcus sp. CS-1325]MCT0212842.1 type II toxin-antitoxin system VapC family toxin [Synechococcus sp. CS-1326]MCT0232886.1 type II toxin-antitoxin system VapC family toxin [Synechococcus sp. CS-1327]PZV01787.1 MAG: VapC toxin family PIN domain ribonuclease [Cyanobium sp.]
MILVDTSVWVDHLRAGVPHLAELLEGGEVLSHPWVIGEIACGHLRARRQVLALLEGLPTVTLASHSEVLLLIERHPLAGRGIGYIDAHLLASAKLSRCSLWTLDRRMVVLGGELALTWDQ